MGKIESSYDIINRTLEKKKLIPIMTDHITNDFAEMLHKRLEQLENHNAKLEKDLKYLGDNVKCVLYVKNELKMFKFIIMFQCNKLNNEKEALKLLIEERDKRVDIQKNLVEIEVQTQNIYKVH